MDVFIAFENRPLYFTRPLSIIRCSRARELPAAFAAMERCLDAGHYLAGFLSYEAGYCFERRLMPPCDFSFPLVMMGVYAEPVHGYSGRKEQSGERPFGRGTGRFRVSRMRLNLGKKTYETRIGRIRDYIAAGQVYQITYCIKFRFRFSGDPLALYAQLLRRQPVPYPAWIRTGEFDILSLSPERFLKKEGGFLVTEPMKGTWPRGRTVASDRNALRRFHRDGKNRAENLMIADLLRNDLGRIGNHVQVPRLFTVTGYTTLFQMTSTVTARTRPDMPLYDLFAALFPSGSVTGCPKIRAMEVIRQLEREPRYIYTGAIGSITPQRDMYFNIPIRTILIRKNEAEMGVGGGIVWDSTPQGEWEEGMLKAGFLIDLDSAGKGW